MRMNKNNYKQYDTRWAKLGYPKSPYFIKDCGCGEVAICNVIIETSKYANETPKTIQPYCKQFAAPNGNGTYFSGIPKMMEHYGLTEVKEHQTMAELWKELKKGGRVAIYLMGNRKGGSKGVHWTSSAHFVCSVDYKEKNGKHYVYVKDSNSTSSSRNGFISYEENMRNDVSRVWSGKLPKSDPAPTPTKSIDEIAKEVIDGKWGNGDERVKKLKAAGYDPDAVQKKVNELLAPKEPTNGEKIGKCANEYAYTTNTTKASYKTGAPTTAYKLGLNKAYPDRSKWGKAPRAGASCDVFVGTCIRNAGIDKDFPRGLAEQIPYLAKSSKFKQVSVTTSTAKDGDIIVYTKTKGGGHICIVYDGKIKEASFEGYYPKTTPYLKQRLSKSGKNWVKVYRAITETVSKPVTLTEKELAACAVQADWMKDSKYKWQSKPTIEKSKYYGTCVTYVACVLQRINYLKPGEYVWHDKKGKIYGTNDKMVVTYPKNKKLSQIKNELKAGDIVLDGDKSDDGAGSHIFIITGKWDGDKPVIWDNHSGQQKKGAYTYTRNRNIIGYVRLK